MAETSEPRPRRILRSVGLWGRLCGGVLAGLILAACEQEPLVVSGADSPTPPREGRFGALRDFVLFERPGPSGGSAGATWFFLDRFEATRADWAAFASTPAGVAVAAHAEAPSADAALPVGLIDLAQARAFAEWRFARLPRLVEWQIAAVGHDRPLPWDEKDRKFPWGSREDATRANTGELGLGEPVPVGTFESGRHASGWPGKPYDLIGNVGEWTESVPASWCSVVILSAARGIADIEKDIDADIWRKLVADYPPPDFRRSAGAEDVDLDEFREQLGRQYGLSAAAEVAEMSGPFALGRRQAMRSAALAVWQQAGGLVPAAFAVAGAGDEVPREVVGADYLTPMTQPVEAVPAGDRRLRIGLRLCTTPRELLVALVATTAVPTGADVEQLRRFVRRERHHAALSAAWPEVARSATFDQLARPLGKALAELLGAPAKNASPAGK